MCYIIHLSTTSEEDLSKLPTDNYFIARADKGKDAAHLTHLAHPQKWFLMCGYGGCSCHFRHWDVQSDEDRNFSAPEDWYPEDAEDIEDTAAVYDLLARLLAEGHRVDLLDSWNGDDLDQIKTLEVSLARTPRSAFRFFSGYRFDLRR